MQLPKEFQHFPEATLIVLTDEQEAKFLLANGDSLEHLDTMVLEPVPMTDKEGLTMTPGGYITDHSLSDKHDTPRKKKFAATVAEEVTQFIQNGKAEAVRFISPPEMMHLIEKKLSNEARERILSRLEKDLMKLSDVEVLERMFQMPD